MSHLWSFLRFWTLGRLCPRSRLAQKFKLTFFLRALSRFLKTLEISSSVGGTAPFAVAMSLFSTDISPLLASISQLFAVAARALVVLLSPPSPPAPPCVVRMNFEFELKKLKSNPRRAEISFGFGFHGNARGATHRRALLFGEHLDPTGIELAPSRALSFLPPFLCLCLARRTSRPRGSGGQVEGDYTV